MSESTVASREQSRAARDGRPDEAAPQGTSIGVCVEGQHPTLQGRSLVRWRDAAGERHEAWIPRLRELRPSRGDRVLLGHPGNHDEPVVMGVLDGLGRRAAPPPTEDGPMVRLAPHEALRVADADGTPLLEIRSTEGGPSVRLLAPAAGVDMPGTLRLSADDIELEARTGEVRVRAAGDVKVAGEIVRLN